MLSNQEKCNLRADKKLISRRHSHSKDDYQKNLYVLAWLLPIIVPIALQVSLSTSKAGRVVGSLIPLDALFVLRVGVNPK